MSAPAYLEGIRRTKPGRTPRAPRPQQTLLLWGFLAVMFLLLWKVFQTSARLPPHAEPAAEPTIVDVVAGSPCLLATALSVAVAVVFAVVFKLLVRSHLGAMVPIEQARIALARGDADRAVEVLRDALRVRRGLGVRSALLHTLAQVAAEQGHFVEVLEIVDQAEAALGQPGSASDRETNDFRVEFRMTRADALLALGRLDEAEVELAPPPPAWLPDPHARAYALTVRLAAGRGDRDGVLRLLREHAVSHERRLTLRERWLLRALEHLARRGHVPADALAADPSLRQWIAARAPGVDATADALGGAE